MPQAQRSDPYTAYRAFVRSVSALAAETAGVDAAARRDAVYAQGRVLRDFSRDLKTAARAPLAAALDALEAQRCTGAASSNADPALLLRAAE